MKAFARIVCSLLLVCASVDAAVADTIVRDLPPGLQVPAGAQPATAAAPVAGGECAPPKTATERNRRAIT
jgi:hypothetical protein